MTTGHNPKTYWDARAERFGHAGGGLAAVCSYGMPRAYNEAIHISQSRSLSRWLRPCRQLDVLDIGCGVGRWSLRLAEQGNRVLGVDVSSSMIALARRRAMERRIPCEFLVQDVVSLDLRRRFDLVLAVTVLQHIIDESDLRTAVANLARHVKAGGLLVMLEVAPTLPTSACDSAVFKARPAASYRSLLAEAGLRVIGTAGVDSGLLRPLLLPAIRTLPKQLGRALAAASAVVSLPLDFFAGRYFSDTCWHKVIVAEPEGEGGQ